MPLINCKINLILTWSEKCVLSDDTKAATFGITDAKLYTLGARDRFIQPILFRIFRCIVNFRRGNGCDMCWSAATSMGDSWKRA